ncbi:MAG TPA: alpha/beta fold hydrolase [Candidatus Acidoferrales bacterium]|nr:alpha/beta fold hydrolase [Candidatus Acidoferrales bacterium]
MKRIVVLALLILATGYAARAQDIVGDWQGTLKIGTSELRLVVHITKGDDGNLKATMDSIDQGANGIPISSISLQDSKLSFTSEAIHGSYEGTINKGATEITGTFTQGSPLPLDLTRMAKRADGERRPVKPSDIDGAWAGVIDTGTSKLRIVFHITNTADGLAATIDSPDQGAKGLPVTVVTRNASALKLELKQADAVFEGKIDKNLTSIDGTWSQRGGSVPLTVKRVVDTAQLERRRPQNPVKPYPYREEDVAYANKAASITIAGTLTIPPGNGPFPAVLLIAGSGRNDRDESLAGHSPFLVLSDYLTRKGIVVLRADKRGVGKSGGDYATATTSDFASDAEAGVAYLGTRPEVDRHKIGLIGHSEGGVIAPMVAAADPNLAFIVMMAGSGVSGIDIIVEQTLLIAEASGQSHEEAEKNAAEERKILTLVEQEKDDAVLTKKLREVLGDKIPEATLNNQIKALTSPWYREFIQYDPATALRKVTCPVLALIGEKDLQVPPDQNLPAIRKALEAGGNKNFEVDELPGLNHLFQSAKTGAPSEYGEIELTISPVALEKISSWILKQPPRN